MLEKPDQIYRQGGEDDPYIRERCAVDLYSPETTGKPFPMLIWYHGGGLEEGSRQDEDQRVFARRFAEQGVGVAMAGYRLSPRVNYPVYVQDAARAVRWVMDRAPAFGGDPDRVFVGGHSAGGYLAALLATDDFYLKEEGVEWAAIAGFIPMSAQVMTHFTIRKERGLQNNQSKVVSDEAAPIFHVRPDTPPLLLILGDNDFPARLEENRYFVAMLEKVAGNGNISLVVVDDRDHGSIAGRCLEPGDPAGAAMLNFIRR